MAIGHSNGGVGMVLLTESPARIKMSPPTSNPDGPFLFLPNPPGNYISTL